MTNKKVNRIAVISLVSGFALGLTGLAFAAPADGAQGERHCDGKGGEHAGGRFQKMDKNADGFLTQDEVGAEKWTRIKVADTNNDGKVTQEEMQQAHKDGKLGHRGKA